MGDWPSRVRLDFGVIFGKVQMGGGGATLGNWPLRVRV